MGAVPGVRSDEGRGIVADPARADLNASGRVPWQRRAPQDPAAQERIMAKTTDDELRAQFEAAMNRQASPSGDAPAQDGSAPAGPGEEESRRGTIAGISGKDVFVDLGERDQGVISIDEFDAPPQVGQSFEFGIVDFADDLFALSRKEARRLESWRAIEVGKWVKARVTGTNTGGLEDEYRCQKRLASRSRDSSRPNSAYWKA